MTIELKKRFGIEKCCGKDEDRPQLTNVFFDAEEGFLSATDGTICARVPVAYSEDEKSRFLTAAEVAAIRAGDKKPDKEQFPLENVKKIFGDIKKEANIRIGIDLELLWRVAEAVGAENGQVVLHLSLKKISNAVDGLHGNNCFMGPIFVTPERGVAEGVAEGVVMPRRVYGK